MHKVTAEKSSSAWFEDVFLDDFVLVTKLQAIC